MPQKISALKTNFFQNTDVGEDFAEFLEFIGSEISLKGWQGYAAGLDVQNDKTGTHALYNKFSDYEIIFHVSTYLPYDADEFQQVSRKRHIGNDIVLLLFQENGYHPLFDPSTIRSYFNHVFIIIRKDHEETQKRGITVYRIAVSFKEGVEMCAPGLPNPPLFEKGEELKYWLYTKMINCERASYMAPGFRQALQRTRKELLHELYNQFYPSQTGGWGLT